MNTGGPFGIGQGRRLDLLLHPHSIAIVGVCDNK